MSTNDGFASATKLMDQAPDTIAYYYSELCRKFPELAKKNPEAIAIMVQACAIDFVGSSISIELARNGGRTADGW